MKRFLSYTVLILLLTVPTLYGQSANKDESKVPTYTLPSLFGTAKPSLKEWEQKIRPHTLKQFQEQVFGVTPTLKLPVRYELKSIKEDALGGKATRKEVRIHFPEGKWMDLMLYIPNNVNKKVPVYIGLNFLGNQSLEDDTSIPITSVWQRNNKGLGVTENRATENTRGASKQNWPLDFILDKGYALATVYYCDLFPDHIDGAAASIKSLFPSTNAANEWGAIGVWAWGLSRMIDYLETEDRINSKQIAAVGHSRLGKAALWAGVQDERIGVVIPNNSGEGGAAITRRKFGETIEILNTNFPHWMAPAYRKYNGKEEELPVDFHQLVALVAPRGICIASASEDWWADPKGEYLSLVHASEAYELYDFPKFPNREMTPGSMMSTGGMAYHLRRGPHDILLYDWERFILFSDNQFGR